MAWLHISLYVSVFSNHDEYNHNQTSLMCTKRITKYLVTQEKKTSENRHKKEIQDMNFY